MWVLRAPAPPCFFAILFLQRLVQSYQDRTSNSFAKPQRLWYLYSSFQYRLVWPCLKEAFLTTALSHMITRPSCIIISIVRSPDLAFWHILAIFNSCFRLCHCSMSRIAACGNVLVAWTNGWKWLCGQVRKIAQRTDVAMMGWGKGSSGGWIVWVHWIRFQKNMILAIKDW